MSKAKTLYDKALSNYNSALILRKYMGDDEEQLNLVAFHLQQALELSIKQTLEENGVECPKTHNIEQLTALAEREKVDLKLGEYITEHAEMFSQWESKSRYVTGYLVEAKKIDRAITEIEKYFKNYES